MRRVLAREPHGTDAWLTLAPYPIAQTLAAWLRLVLQDDSIESVSKLQDGLVLAKLVEALSGREVLGTSVPQNNAQNVTAAFAAMRAAGLETAAISCAPEDLLEGTEPDVIEALVFDLAQHFVLAPLFPRSSGSLKAAVLAWVQEHCGPRGVSVTDLHRSMQDGLALCALVDAAAPGALDAAALADAAPRERVRLALAAAHGALGVVPFLELGQSEGDDAELAAPEPGVMLYLATLRRAADSRGGGQGGGGQGDAAPPRAAGGARPATAADEAAAARAGMQRGLLGRGVVDGAGAGEEGGTEELRVVQSLLQELQDPIKQVAEVLESHLGGGAPPGSGDSAAAKATFRQLTEKMRRLVEVRLRRRALPARTPRAERAAGGSAQVLPDTLAATNEAQRLEDAIQAELHKARPGPLLAPRAQRRRRLTGGGGGQVRARAEFEEAYVARVLERQGQCRQMSAALQTEIAERFQAPARPAAARPAARLRGRRSAGLTRGRARGQVLRAPVAELLASIDERERLLQQRVQARLASHPAPGGGAGRRARGGGAGRVTSCVLGGQAIEQDKAAILTQVQAQSERDLQRMREAEGRAGEMLRSKIASVQWLETGARAEQVLAACDAGRMEGKADFPEEFVDFNCSLELAPQRAALDAALHVLRGADFEEAKALAQAESLAQRGGAAAGPRGSRGAAGPRESVDVALRASRGAGAGAGSGANGWLLDADGAWRRMAGLVGAGGGADGADERGAEASELEQVLAHARALPPREADAYLSQEVSPDPFEPLRPAPRAPPRPRPRPAPEARRLARCPASRVRGGVGGRRGGDAGGRAGRRRWCRRCCGARSSRGTRPRSCRRRTRRRCRTASGARCRRQRARCRPPRASSPTRFRRSSPQARPPSAGAPLRPTARRAPPLRARPLNPRRACSTAPRPLCVGTWPPARRASRARELRRACRCTRARPRRAATARARCARRRRRRRGQGARALNI